MVAYVGFEDDEWSREYLQAVHVATGVTLATATQRLGETQYFDKIFARWFGLGNAWHKERVVRGIELLKKQYDKSHWNYVNKASSREDRATQDLKDLVGGDTKPQTAGMANIYTVKVAGKTQMTGNAPRIAKGNRVDRTPEEQYWKDTKSLHFIKFQQAQSPSMYVPSTGLIEIHNAFFAQSAFQIVSNAQIHTIVHEMTHLFLGTDDIKHQYTKTYFIDPPKNKEKKAYGEKMCKRLAQSDVNLAIQNADNWAHFVIDFTGWRF